MISRISKQTFHARVKALFSSPAALAATLQGLYKRKKATNLVAEVAESAEGEQLPFPEDLNAFLSQLQLLINVPVNYLIPDIKMLPPESMRFFYYDQNWIDALLDGAYSIGRSPSQDSDAPDGGAGANPAFYKTDEATQEWLNHRIGKLSGEKLKTRLAKGRGSTSMRFDQATFALTRKQIDAQSQQIRNHYLGHTNTASFSESGDNEKTVSGFLLRSEVVIQHPLLEVKAYEAGKTPEINGQTNPNVELAKTLYMKVLPEQPDTILCLFLGDVVQVDLTEPAEQLHFGVDSRTIKRLKRYTTTAVVNEQGVVTDEITLLDSSNPDNSPSVDLTNYYRDSDQRTINMHQLADEFGRTLGVEVDAAVLGFQMTQGVGMVQFDKN